MDNDGKILLLFYAAAFCITSIFLVWYFVHKARHKERMMMLEKGINPTKAESESNGTFQTAGIVILGLGIGLVIIEILSALRMLGSDALPLAVLGICGGTAMIVANRIKNK